VASLGLNDVILRGAKDSAALATTIAQAGSFRGNRTIVIR
jgi:hypothetical protein